MLHQIVGQELFALFIFGIAFAVTYFIIPKIIWVVHSRDLIDKPDFRSSHKESTPTMAGVAFFLAMIALLFFINGFDADAIAINLVAALTVVFSIGLKDDLVLSSPKAKTIGHLMAIAALLLNESIQSIQLEGFLGVQVLPIYISLPILGFIILSIVNAYNLIDGIDGLAAIIGMVIFSGFSIIFYQLEMSFYFLLSIGLIGVLLAYLRYNFSKMNKIFMGDTGSLIIGFSIAFLAVKLVTTDLSGMHELPFFKENKVIVLLSIIGIPLFDTLRVMGVRLLNNKSLFSPDRNHIHHILIDCGLKHYKASLFIAVLNLLIAFLVVVLSAHLHSFEMLGVLLFIFALLLLFFDKMKENIATKNSCEKLISWLNYMT